MAGLAFGEAGRSMGRFWLAGQDAARTQTGVAMGADRPDRDRRRRRTDPGIEFTSLPGGAVRAAPPPEIPDFVVHAVVPTTPSRVTFLGCQTLRRRTQGFPGLSANTQHVVKADCA
jgi:hypothetical protein